jgi:hypothetical protein
MQEVGVADLLNPLDGLELLPALLVRQIEEFESDLSAAGRGRLPNLTERPPTEKLL